MTWLAWRLQRAPLALCAALIAVIGAGLAVHRLAIVDHLGAMTADAGGFGESLYRFGDQDQLVHTVLLAVPVLLGLFWAAPLFAREFEARTHLMVLSQSVGRGRWFGTKVAVLVAGALAVAAVLSALRAWWAAPGAAYRADDALFTDNFSVHGALLLPYCLFAVVLGAITGLIAKRVVPAMAITLGAYAATFLTLRGLRETFMAPRYADAGLEHTPEAPAGAWRLDSGYLSSAGDRISELGLGTPPCWGEPDRAGCFQREGLVGQYLAYHPADRFWTFQAIEASILVGLAAVLLGVGLWWVHKRMR